DVVALDELSVLIEEKTAIVVTVPCESEIGSLLAHHLYGGSPILFQHWIRYAVGKITVRIVEQLDEHERQARLEPIDDQTCAAIASIDHDLERLELGQVNIAQQMLEVSVARVQRGALALMVPAPAHLG